MRSVTLGLAAAVLMGALSAAAQAGDCKRIAAVGQMLTHDTGPQKYHRIERPRRAGTCEDDLRR